MLVIRLRTMENNNKASISFEHVVNVNANVNRIHIYDLVTPTSGPVSDQCAHCSRRNAPVRYLQ